MTDGTGVVDSSAALACSRQAIIASVRRRKAAALSRWGQQQAPCTDKRQNL
jgi:hypothetical protein